MHTHFTKKKITNQALFNLFRVENHACSHDWSTWGGRKRVALLRAHELQLTMSDVHNMRDVQLHWFGQWIYGPNWFTHQAKYLLHCYLQVILRPDTDTNSLPNNSPYFYITATQKMRYQNSCLPDWCPAVWVNCNCNHYEIVTKINMKRSEQFNMMLNILKMHVHILNLQLKIFEYRELQLHES